eukprot:g28958.t1
MPAPAFPRRGARRRVAGRSQFMAANEESLRSILQRNPSLQREQFQVPNPLRPKTFIMGGTLLAPVGLVATETSAVSLQMSPDFTGSPFYPKESNFAFGGSSPLSAQGQMGGDAVEMEAPPTSFSLADAIGISSAAFASVLVSAGWLTSAASFFIGHQAEEYLPVKDVWPSGWKLEDFRMPLLQRKVSKILVVDSTNVELSEDIDFCTANVLGLSLKGKVSNDLLDKFGYAAENPGEYLIYNQVFHADELQPKKRMAGDAMVVQRDLEVLANSKWGIEGNWRVSVVFAYLSSPRRFTVNLPPETLQEVEKGSSGKFANWPHFKTSSQNGPTKFTSYTREQRVLQTGEDFILPPIDRPRAFVMLGVLLAPLGHESEDDTVVSLQMSPDFSGSPFYPGGHGNIKYDEESTNWFTRADIPALKMVIGGGMVETFAFGGDTPYDQSGQSGGDRRRHGVKMPSPSEPLSLAKAIGVSSAAFTAMISQALNNFGGQTMQALIPVTTMWPITSRTQPGPKAAAKFKIGDGGHMDNSGLLPILQRKDFCGSRRMTSPELNSAATWYFVDKFGLAAHMKGQFQMHNQASKCVVKLLILAGSSTQVFHFADLQPMLCDLQTHRRAGRPAAALRKLEVLKNSWWGIEGGWTVELLVIYMDKTRLFERRLPEDTRKEIKAGKDGMFANFPHFPLMQQNPGSLTSFTSAQVNLLSAQVEFSVRKHAGLLREVLQGIPRNPEEPEESDGFEDLNPNERREDSSNTAMAGWEGAR